MTLRPFNKDFYSGN